MKISIKTISAFILPTIMLISSCHQDPCDGKRCSNSQVTVKSGNSCNCECQYGFTGDSCNQINIAVLNGVYAVKDTSDIDGEVSNYNATLTINPSTNTGTITDIDDELFLNPVSVTLSGTTLSIAEQEPDGDGVKISGSGTISSQNNSVIQIRWIYTISDVSDPTGEFSSQGIWVK